MKYRDADWLMEAKERAISNGTGLKGMAEEASCSTHCIRKWLKIHGLQFTKKEVAQYSEIWNKGIPKEQQPRYNKTVSDFTRDLMKESSRKGEDSNLWCGGVDRCFRQEVWDWQYKYKNKLLKEQPTCRYCNSDKNLQIDHIVAVSADKSLAFEYSNLQILCYDCHLHKSIQETKLAKAKRKELNDPAQH